jgi:hypothetical protein
LTQLVISVWILVKKTEHVMAASNRSLLEVVGFIASIGFMVWAVAALSFRRVANWGPAEMFVFLLLWFLFSGPIAYYWISASSKTQIKFPWGTLTMGGGYVAAIAIFFFAKQIPPVTQSVLWKAVDLDTQASNPDEVVAYLPPDATGHVWVISEDHGSPPHNKREWALVLRFDGYDPELQVELRFYSNVGVGDMVVHVPRDGSLKPHLAY